LSRLFREELVTIQSAYQLQGTLTLPEIHEGRVPIIIFLPGSGKINRDANHWLIKLRLFREMAHFFATSGYASFRYDKRGVGESGGNFLRTGLWDLVDDAESVLDYIANDPRIDPNRIIVLGHSEGAFLTPLLYARKTFQGMVLLSGACNFEDAIQFQTQHVFRELEELSGLKGYIIRKLRIIEKQKRKTLLLFQRIKESKKDIIRVQGIIKINAKWYREHFKTNYEPYFTKVCCPALIITGDKDVQVPPEHAPRLAEWIGEHAQWHIIKDMNHILRKDLEPIKMLNLKKSYKRLAKVPVDKEMLKTIQEWLVQTQ
jgi:dipeptidyl aminopeptidase/acylaminoacyl peptidase